MAQMNSSTDSIGTSHYQEEHAQSFAEYNKTSMLDLRMFEMPESIHDHTIDSSTDTMSPIMSSPDMTVCANEPIESHNPPTRFLSLIIDDQSSHKANKKCAIRAFKCSICKRQFTQKATLNTHMRTHTGERPFKCTYEGCDKAFAQLGNLKAHFLLHEDLKPFICAFPGCEKAFRQKSNLKTHWKTHKRQTGLEFGGACVKEGPSMSVSSSQETLETKVDGGRDYAGGEYDTHNPEAMVIDEKLQEEALLLIHLSCH